MPSLTLWSETNSLWLIFTLYFVTGMRHRIQVKRYVPLPSFERVSLLLVTALLFFPRTHLSFLAIRFHNSHAIALTGLILTILGLAFSAWARDVLGCNWSGRVIIQVDHQLITTGPYAYVRHPLYTGLLIALTGTALVSGDYGSLLGLFLVVTIFRLKARREEQLLETEFGAGYAVYRAHTGSILPRIAHV
ncbi:MAG TPA: isoprenylcysteine carboxylmethyltransferase family protein [Edaphobacter sp.]